MKINRIQSNNTNFKGQIIENDALKNLKTKLTPVQAETVKKYIKYIEKINDNKTFVYDSLTVGGKIISKIHIMDVNGNLRKQPFLIEFGRDPIKIFEQMANWYKHIIVR